MVAGGHNPTKNLSDFTTKVTAGDMILAYLKRKHEQGFLTVTRRELVQNLPWSEKTIDQALRRLKKRGKIENPFYGNWRLSRNVAGNVTNPYNNGHESRDEVSDFEGGGWGVSGFGSWSDFVDWFGRIFDPAKPIKRHNLEFYVKGHPNRFGSWSDEVVWTPPSGDNEYRLRFYGRKNGRIDLYVNCSDYPMSFVRVLQMLEFARGYLRFGLGIENVEFVWVNFDSNIDHRDIEYRGRHIEVKVFEGLSLALYRKRLKSGEEVTRVEWKNTGRALSERKAERILLEAAGLLRTANTFEKLGNAAIESMKQVATVSSRLSGIVDTQQALLLDVVSGVDRIEQTVADHFTDIGIGIQEIKTHEERQTQILEGITEISERQTEILSRIESRTHNISAEIQEMKRWAELSREERERILDMYYSHQLQVRSLRELASLLQTHHSTISQWIRRNQMQTQLREENHEEQRVVRGNLPGKYQQWWPAVHLILESNEEVSYAEIMHALGISRTYAADLLSAYWKAGLLTRELRGRKYVYSLRR